MQNSIDQLTQNYQNLMKKLERLVKAYLAMSAAQAEKDAISAESYPKAPTAIVNLESYLKWFAEKEAYNERWNSAVRAYDTAKYDFDAHSKALGYEAEARVWHKVAVGGVEYGVAVEDCRGRYPLINRWAVIDPALPPEWPWVNAGDPL